MNDFLGTVSKIGREVFIVNLDGKNTVKFALKMDVFGLIQICKTPLISINT